MANLTNTIQNNALAALTGQAPHGVVKAIQTASVNTGVNFAYLVQQASAESSFNPTAKAKTSSASGLFQFIESTWMNMVEKYGDKYGIETEGKSKKEILALRNDPKTSSFMAAEFANENKQFLDTHWGGKVGSTELYFAHFLGAGGAAAFLKAHDENPSQAAALIFPKAAQSNRNVFYDTKTGRMKSMEEVYAFFDKKFQIKDSVQPDIQVAQTAPDAQRSNIDVETLAAMADIAPAPEPSAYQGNSLFNLAHSYIKNANAPAERMPAYSLVSSPVELMMLAQMDHRNDAHDVKKADESIKIAANRFGNSQKSIFSLFSGTQSYNN